MTIAALTGSDSAPVKANESSQKNDIGTAKDDVTLTATNAITEAYEAAYVENGVSAGDASTTVGTIVRNKLNQKYGTDGNYKIGLATITATSAGEIEISTTDFTEYGLIELSGGTLKWITPVPITTIGAITPSNPEVEEGKEIVLSVEINEGATEKVTWESDDETIATVVSSGKNTATVKAMAGKAGEEVTITAKNVDGSISVNTIINVIEAPVPALSTKSYVGYYAEVDGVWGIIYADLLMQKPDATLSPWGNYNGVWSFPSGTSTDPNVYKNYLVSSTIPTGKTIMSETGYESTGVISLASGGGSTNRFLVMAMDNESGTYTWEQACALSGQKNNGWTLPTQEQWSMFGSAFGVTKSNYNEERGLSNYYWSSSKVDTNGAWCAYLRNGYMSNNGKTWAIYVRLCTTF